MLPTDAAAAPAVPVLGIVGAGQLARMMHQATIGLAIDLRVLAADAEDSAAVVTPATTVGSWTSLDDLRAFAEQCDVVTFDHELTDPAHLATLVDEGHVLRPAPAAELFAQDKRFQREQLRDAGFPVPAFAVVTDGDELARFGEAHGWPVVIKTARGGYDGRGVWVVHDESAGRARLAELADAGDVVAEELVDLDREVAVAVARRPSGESAAWAVTETVQQDGICTELVVPAPVDDDVAEAARDLATRLVEHVDGTGVVAVELFLTTGGDLLVNELALRPHNSVHWTIEGARTSQFQNHVRAVLDLPLGDTSLAAPAVATVNVLGPDDGSDPRENLAAALAVEGVAVHLYGKDARPGRKLGHVTALADDVRTARRRAHEAAGRLTGTDAAEADR